MKKTLLIKILALTLTISSLLCILTACDGGSETPPHTHDYKTLKFDSQNHWFECECEEKSNVTAHNLTNGECLCGYVAPHVHDYSAVKFDSENHWNECECGEKSSVTVHSLTNGECSCGYVAPHVHDYKLVKFDTQNHWFECECGEKSSITEHSLTNGECLCGYVAPHEHDYSLLKYDSENHWFECSCGKKATTTAHTLVNESCVCGYVTPHTHDYKTLKYDNENHWFECSCGEKSTVSNHSFTNYVYNNDAKCEKDGTETATCDNNCGATHTRTKVNTAFPHSYTNYVYNNDAKCLVNGTETARCDNNCGVPHTREKANTALSHRYINYVYNNDAKCEVNGTETAKCNNNCGKTHTREKANSALSHRYTNYVYNNDAKCLVNGTETATCDNCGKINTRTKLNTALSHSYTNYVYNNDAKCLVNGTETAICDNNCGKTNTRYKNNTALSHSFTNYVYNNDAKCEKDGTETAKCDNNCSVTRTRTKANSALSHRYSDYVSNGNNTHTKTCLNDSSHKITENCFGGTATCAQKAICEDCHTEYGEKYHTISGQKFIESRSYLYSGIKSLVDAGDITIIGTPTCRDYCEANFECEMCFESVTIYVYDNHKVNGVTLQDFNGKTEGYAWSEIADLVNAGKVFIIDNVPSTCTQLGEATFYCDDCRLQYKIFVYADHDLGAIQTVHPDCLTGGYSYQVCKVCGDEVKVASSDTAVLGHTFIEDEDARVDNKNGTYTLRFNCECGEQRVINATLSTDSLNTFAPTCKVEGQNAYVYADPNTGAPAEIVIPVAKLLDHTCNGVVLYDSQEYAYSEIADLVAAGKVVFIGNVPVACNDLGEATFFCDVCDFQYKIFVYADHDYEGAVEFTFQVVIDGVVYDCTAIKCNVCGKSLILEKVEA